MKIAVCDDEMLCRSQIISLLNEYIKQNPNRNITVSEYANAENLLDAISKGCEFDIYILDVVMPGMNGIELGIELRKQGIRGKIIYLTSNEEFAIDSYKAKATNYILKPVVKDELFSTLDEIAEQISAKEKSLIVKTSEGITRLSYDNITYAELVRKAIVYHLADGSTVESTTIRTAFSKAVEELLCDSSFFLCGSSMIVNLYHVSSVKKDSLVFRNERILFLPKSACLDVRSAWIDFWFKEESRI